MKKLEATDPEKVKMLRERIIPTPSTSAGYKSAPQQQQQQQPQKERESDWSPPSFSNRSRRLSGDLEINPMNPADLAQTQQQQQDKWRPVNQQWNMEQQQQPGMRAGQNQSNFGRRMEEEDFEQIPLNPMFANRSGAFSQNFNRNNTSKYDNW